MNRRVNPNGLSDEQAAFEYRNGASTPEIARRWGTNAKQVGRMLERAGCPRRDQREARERAKQAGRIPKNGQPRPPRSESHRASIGQSQAARWASLSSEERQRISERSREAVRSRQGEFGKAGLSRLRAASKDGSKLAAAVCAALVNADLPVDVYPSVALPGRTVKPACVVCEPGVRPVAVLVFGPSHFLPVFGEAKLLAQRTADDAAVALLEGGGFSVLRVEADRKSLSKTFMQQLCDKVVSSLPRAKALRVVTARVDNVA